MTSANPQEAYNFGLGQHVEHGERLARGVYRGAPVGSRNHEGTEPRFDLLRVEVRPEHLIRGVPAGQVSIERGVMNRVNVAVAGHVILGMLTLLLGGWVVLVAGTNVVPPRWRFRDYKAWMRTLLALWWLTIAFGVATYLFASV